MRSCRKPRAAAREGRRLARCGGASRPRARPARGARAVSVAAPPSRVGLRPGAARLARAPARAGRRRPSGCSSFASPRQRPRAPYVAPPSQRPWPAGGPSSSRHARRGLRALPRRASGRRWRRWRLRVVPTRVDVVLVFPTRVDLVELRRLRSRFGQVDARLEHAVARRPSSRRSRRPQGARAGRGRDSPGRDQAKRPRCRGREPCDPASPAHTRSSAAWTRAKDGRTSRRAVGCRAKDPDDRATGADS
jgi:hypothetical protein